MRYFLNIAILLLSVLSLSGVGLLVKELVLAEIPTILIVAGCAGCVLIAAAVVLAALRGVKTTNKL